MRKFEKSSKLDNVCYDVRGPVVDEAAKMEATGVPILKLNIGNPAPFGFSAPTDITQAMASNLRNTEGYCDSKGILSAREAIVSYCAKKNIPGVGINDIYTGNGVSELIVMVMQGLLDDGDEVLLPAPDYPLWTAAVNLSGGRPVHYICDEQAGWYPDMADIRSKITKRTKALVVINPNNPTGALYPREVLEDLVQIARENELIIFADEIYDRLVMDGKEHISIASLAPDLFCITMNGLSKSHKVAGYRVGWMCLSGDKSNVGGYIEGLNMLSSMRLCSNVPAQAIVETALAAAEEPDGMILPGGRIYEQREFIYRAVNDIPGLSAVKPEAAFYIFPKLDVKRFGIRNDEQFALDFLKAQQVLLVHGGGFNLNTPDHFRIVFLPEMEQLMEAMNKLELFLKNYRQS